MELRIKDANGQTNLLIEIIGRETDEEWLICMVFFKYDGFEIKLKFSSMRGDFCSFLSQLETFYKSLRGKAQFTSIEHNVSFELSTDGLGHVDINGNITHGNYDVKTVFLIESDQTVLPELIQEVKQICRPLA